MPEAVVFHVQTFLERPNTLVFATASAGLNALTRRTPDPLLRTLFTAREQAAEGHSEPLRPELGQRVFALMRRQFTPLDAASRPSSTLPLPPSLANLAGSEAWTAICEEAEKRQAPRDAVGLCTARRFISETQASLAANPWNNESNHDAAISLCWLGRMAEAEDLIRARLRRCPSDAQGWRMLADVLILARRYDEAIAAMNQRRQLGGSGDRDDWVEAYRFRGGARQAEATLWSHTKAPVARALLLQGRAEEALAISKEYEADPLTRALIQHSRGQVEAADATSGQIESLFDLAVFHAWRGDADKAMSAMIFGLNASIANRESMPLRGLLNILHSPFLDPIRSAPEWIEWLELLGLTPQNLATIPFERGSCDAEAVRRASDLEIRAHASKAAQAFAADPAGRNGLTLGIQLFNLGRFAEAEKVLRWESVRDSWSDLPHKWLGEVFLATGRLKEAEAQAEIAQGKGGSYKPGALARLLEGQAQSVYEEESQAEEPDKQVLALAAHTLGYSSRRDALRLELAKLSLVHVIPVHAWAGDADRVFECMNQVVADGLTHELLRFIVHSPFMAPIHADPRWPAFLSTVNMLPEQLATIPLKFELPPLRGRALDSAPADA